MRQWFTILFLLIASYSFAERRALAIGIGEYPNVAYGWDAINGDNDVQLVVEMLQCNGFATHNINTLSNQQATYNGILQAIEQLVKQSTEGDIVYIHFSGHGQQITDLNGDEQDGFDEAWIPYDALISASENYYGQYHLTDDELNHYLHQLRQRVGKEGRIIVVSDACHSGTGTRKLGERGIRGTSAKLLLQNRNGLPQYKSYGEKWVHLSACANNECNRQVVVDGISYGSLTYALYLLRDKLTLLTAAELHAILTETLQNSSFISRPQTPQLECYKSLQEQPIL